MRGTSCSCLLVFTLGCNVAAEIIHRLGEDNQQQVSVRCPPPMERKVLWSREINGRHEDLLTVDGDQDIRHRDPGKRYSSLADKSLSISRVHSSDSGKYFCNNRSAGELTVIPSGTPVLQAAEATSITLTCPGGVGGSDVPTWRRERAGDQQPARHRVSAVNRTLTITDVQLGDSGLYYCDNTPAAHLTVTAAETSDGGQQTHPGLVLGFGIPFFFFLLLLLLVVVIIFVWFTWRRRSKTQEEGCVVYEEIQAGSAHQPANGAQSSPGPTGARCTPPFPEKCEPAECTYSLLGCTLPRGNADGSSQLTDHTYFLTAETQSSWKQPPSVV